jgi:N-acetylmuramic acid 6-phosphate etherase
MNPEDLDELDDLETEARNQASLNLDAMTSLAIVQLMNDEDAEVIRALTSVKNGIARAIDAIAERLAEGGRLVYLGAGTSGRLGVLDATECPPTFNTPPQMVVGLIAGGPEALTRAVEGAEDRPEFAVNDLKAIGFSSHDVLVGIATSGRTPYVLGGVRYARELGATTIGISCNRGSALGEAVDIPIAPVVGAEVLSGSTRLKAGTATKLILNMFSTGAMVRLGKTYGNLMVDLRATNTKLQARTNRIIRILTGLSVEAANELLKDCNGELKTALVSALGNLPPAAARQRLGQSDGKVRQALPVLLPKLPGRAPGEDRLVLGIDGGGTNTTALLARVSSQGDFELLGRGRAAGSNIQAHGVHTALQHVGDAIAAAFQQANLAEGPIEALCIGLAGAGPESNRRLIAGWAQQQKLAARVDIRTDVELLFAAGTPAGWGLAVIAGTGSIAWCRAADGRTARAGGWGDIMGDEGSGFALSHAALRGIARATDGRGPATLLTPRVLAHFGTQDPYELTRLVRTEGRRSELAPIVFEVAAEGDVVARQIVAQGATHLAQSAVAAVRRLGLASQPLPVALAGGVLVNHESYRQLLIAELIAAGLRLHPIQVVHEPAKGAVQIAAELIPR